MSVLANTLFGRRLFAANILLGRRLFAANVGDPRVVLCCSGGLCAELTSGHKPNRPDEALSYSILTIEDCNDAFPNLFNWRCKKSELSLVIVQSNC